jgi:hypothetical protein
MIADRPFLQSVSQYSFGVEHKREKAIHVSDPAEATHTSLRMRDHLKIPWAMIHQTQDSPTQCTEVDGRSQGL